MLTGWIKSHRSLMEHWVHEDPFTYRAWCDLLHLVNHKDGKIMFCGEAVTIHKGQRLTSMKKLSLLWNCDVKKVERTLNAFKKDSMIITENFKHKGTLITIVNYKQYQGFSEGERESNDHSVDHSNDSSFDHGSAYGDDYSSAQGSALQTRMNKNDYKNDITTKKKTPAGAYSIFGGELE